MPGSKLLRTPRTNVFMTSTSGHLLTPSMILPPITLVSTANPNQGHCYYTPCLPMSPCLPLRCPCHYPSCSTATSQASNRDLSALQEQVSCISEEITGIRLALDPKTSSLGARGDSPTSGNCAQSYAGGSVDPGQDTETSDESNDEL